MDFDDRLCWMLLGCLIGFALGYIARYLQEIKEELDQVDDTVKNLEHKAKRDSSGFMRYPIVSDIVLLLVVVLTVYAAFASQRASNEVERTQERIKHVSYCNQEILAEAISVLNERTTYTRSQAAANVELQKAQAQALQVIMRQPRRSESERDAAANQYFMSLVDFLEVSRKAAKSVKANDYPTVEDLEACLE